jgi:hypothetical protein
MKLTETHKRDYVPTPAELLAALGIPSGPQEEAGIYISEARPDRIQLNAPFGVMAARRGYLVPVAQASSPMRRPSLPWYRKDGGRACGQ